ncbi:MAG TPA: hypothetical protein VFC19_24095 [Candidatus Limnocylindrales bacterium]|nr:hypothetical protein [Candidatus Limnocylindrales bacterium]
MSPHPEPQQPPEHRVQIDVTIVLPRRIVWLLAGIAVGDLPLPDVLLEKATIVLKALLPV